MRLKIGDDFLDSDNSIIAQTFAVNEIGDIQTQQGGFSNDFTIPLTAKNKSILGFPDNINSASRNPYEKVNATLFDKGVPIAEGYLRYTVVSDTELEASFLSDNVNWFNLLKGKKMTDLDLSEYDHGWNGTTIQTIIAADKDSGHVYPFIEYGMSRYPDGFNNENIYINNFLPAMFVHTLVDRIFFEVGWKVTGKITESPLYKRMILPFSAKSFIHSTTWRDDNTQSDTVNAPFVTPGVGGPSAIPWNGAGGTTINWTGEDCRLRVFLLLRVSGAVSFSITITIPGSASYSETLQAPTGTQEYNITSDLMTMVAASGGTIQVTITDNAPFGALTISATSTIEIIPDLEIVTSNANTTETIQMSVTMPDISQADFIKHISFTFGGIFQANPLSKTVTWSFFRDIKNNLLNALDWSDKLDMSKTREIDFTELLNNYGQESSISYLTDSKDDQVDEYNSQNNTPFGNGVINIDNEHITSTKEIYKSPFAATINIDNFNRFPSLNAIIFYLPYIPYYNWDAGVDTGTNPSILSKLSPKPRLLIMSKNINLSDYPQQYSSIKILGSTGSSISAIPFSWFAKREMNLSTLDTNIDTLAFDQVNVSNVIGDPLIERFLSDYDNILNSMKYLSASLWLTEADIANLDFTIPIYLDRYKSYFYISKIEDFQGRERTTECELVKIS